MKKISLLLLALACSARAGGPFIWNGTFSKSLTPNVNIGDAAWILTGTANPTSTPTAGIPGSLYLSSGGAVYGKTDAGTSTNWVDLSSSSGISIGTANGLNLAGSTLSLGLSGVTNNGALSAADWNTFNAKQNALGYTPVNRAGDTMSGALGVQAFRFPFSNDPLILAGDDTDSGPYSTGDGDWYMKMNGFVRQHWSQNYVELLGSVTVQGNIYADNLPFVVDLSDPGAVTGTLPVGSGGTGNTSMGAFGSIPFHSSTGGGILDTDWEGMHYNDTQQRVEMKNYSVGGNYAAPVDIGNIGGVIVSTSVSPVNVGLINQSIQPGSYQYVQGPAYNSQLNGVSTSLVIGRSIGFAISSASNIDLLKVDEVSNNISTDSVIRIAEFRTTTPALRGTIGQLTIEKVSPNVNPGELQEITGSIIGKDVILPGVTSNTSVVALRASTNNAVVTVPFSRPISAAFEGPIQGVATVTHQPGNPNGVDQVNLLVAQVLIPSDSSTSIIGLSTPANLTVNGNLTGTALGFGAVSTAYVGLLGITSGVTIESVGGNIAALVNTFGSTGGTGGHANRTFGYRPRGILPGGGSNTFGDIAGFWFANGDCSGISPCYSLDSEDPSAIVRMAGPVQAAHEGNAAFTCSGSSTIDYQENDFFASIGNISSGDCQIDFASSRCALQAICTYSIVSAAGDVGSFASVPTDSEAIVRGSTILGAPLTSYSGQISCKCQ